MRVDDNAKTYIRRTWFLERVLKLGLIQIAKEYECVRRFSLFFLFSRLLQGKKKRTTYNDTLQCPSCPDPLTCARLLDEKWRQAYHAVFRFGPCQPSMVFRYLRTLEGVSPPLALSHLTCQTTAKAFVATRTSSCPTTHNTHRFNYYYLVDQCLIGCSRSVCAEAERTLHP